MFTASVVPITKVAVKIKWYCFYSLWGSGSAGGQDSALRARSDRASILMRPLTSCVTVHKDSHLWDLDSPLINCGNNWGCMRNKYSVSAHSTSSTSLSSPLFPLPLFHLESHLISLDKSPPPPHPFSFTQNWDDILPPHIVTLQTVGGTVILLKHTWSLPDSTVVTGFEEFLAGVSTYLDGFSELQSRGHCPNGWAHEGSRGIPLQADFLPGISNLVGLLGHCALLLARVQHLSGILHFPFDPEPSIFLQKLFPGILDSQLEAGIWEANFLPGIKPLLEGGCACWLAKKALLDPNTRSDTSHSWSGIEPANKNCNIKKIWISTVACGSSRVVVILGTKEVLEKPESCFLLEETIQSIQRLLSQFYAF